MKGLRVPVVNVMLGVIYMHHRHHRNNHIKLNYNILIYHSKTHHAEGGGGEGVKILTLDDCSYELGLKAILHLQYSDHKVCCILSDTNLMKY